MIVRVVFAAFVGAGLCNATFADEYFDTARRYYLREGAKVCANPEEYSSSGDVDGVKPMSDCHEIKRSDIVHLAKAGAVFHNDGRQQTYLVNGIDEHGWVRSADIKPIDPAN